MEAVGADLLSGLDKLWEQSCSAYLTIVGADLLKRHAWNHGQQEISWASDVKGIPLLHKHGVLVISSSRVCCMMAWLISAGTSVRFDRHYC